MSDDYDCRGGVSNWAFLFGMWLLVTLGLTITAAVLIP